MKLSRVFPVIFLWAIALEWVSAFLDDGLPPLVLNQGMVVPDIGQRSLQSLDDLDTVRLGDDKASITVTIDQTAANGALTFGEKFVVVRPAVAGSGTQVTCTATMASSLVNMQFFLRKAIKPDTDENGNAKDFDCGAMNDNDLIGPDVESCTVTNFNAIGDLVVGYVAVLDTAFNMGATYTINFLCNRIDPPTEGGGGCFSKDSTMDVLGKGQVKMTDLSVGDMVQTGLSYEPIYAFAHLDHTGLAEYIQIFTKDNRHPLEVTMDHLLWVNGKFVPASAVQVGDSIMDGNRREQVVKRVAASVKQGLYAPLTHSGELVVNGIRTSAYVSLQQAEGQISGNVIIGGMDTGISFHSLNHVALSPIRMACMGVSSAFCQAKHISKESGYPPFVSFWFKLVQWFEKQVLAIQVILLVLFFAVVGPLFIMESAVGACLAPVLALGVLVLVRTGTGRTTLGRAKAKVA